MWLKICGILVAGGVGSLARYGLQGWVQRLHDLGFPFGTLVVNVLGCFLFGFVWSLADERALIGPELRAVLLVGFMGGFTTYSTFAFETGQMLRDTQWLFAALYLGGHFVLGLVFLFLGTALARWI